MRAVQKALNLCVFLLTALILISILGFWGEEIYASGEPLRRFFTALVSG
jgi:hypothetical protein